MKFPLKPLFSREIYELYNTTTTLFICEQRKNFIPSNVELLFEPYFLNKNYLSGKNGDEKNTDKYLQAFGSITTL